MEIKDIRVLNLKLFVEKNNGAANMARIWPEIDPSYISQLVNGHRGFGEKAARKLENICKLPANYFDNHHTNQTLANYSLDVSDEITIKSVPLISWVQAGAFRESIENINDAEKIYTDAKIKPTTYALRVNGDSMSPTFPEGMILIVDPELVAIHNDFVIAKNGDNEATFKQLVQDGADWYLKPLNPAYPIKSAINTQIIGVVIQAQLVEKLK